jgi:hypothetical protein
MRKSDKQNTVVQDGFFSSAKIIDELLPKLKYMDISEARLYFCSKEQMALAYGAQKQLEGLFTLKKHSKYSGFSRIANLLNPSILTHTYTVGVRAKYRQIIDAAKVKKELEGEFACWKNTTLKRARDYIAAHTLDERSIDDYTMEVQGKIAAAQAQYDFVLNNFEEVEVRIVGYDKRKSYPYITFYENKKKITKHLSITAPNLLMLEINTYRSNMEAVDFIENGINAFGDVYYLRKGE